MGYGELTAYGPIQQAGRRIAEEAARRQAAEYGQSLTALFGTPPEAYWTNNRKEEGMLERLKNFAASDSAPDVDGFVELAAYGRALKAEYAAQEVPAPKWLETNLRLLSGRIKDAYRRQQEEKLRRVEKEIEELRSKEEKKAVKEKEAAELRRALGLDGERAGE